MSAGITLNDQAQTASFYVVAVTPAGEVPVPNYGPYANGGDAAAAAKMLQANLGPGNGYKYQPRRMSAADPNAWKDREAKRFADGTYRALPAEWAPYAKIDGHFLHISTKTGGRVEYFDNNENGILDRAIETTPGRYLKQFFPQVGDLAAKELIAKIDNMSEVLFAGSRKEIRWVYENGPNSCMSKSARTYNNVDVHPAECYASGDLFVAYLKTKDGSKASARAVCCPRTKEYGNVYGDHARLHDQLRKLGFKNVGSFSPGVKLAKHPKDKEGINFVMSYADNYGMMVDRGDHFETVSLRGGSYDTEKYRGQILISPGTSGGVATAMRHCPKMGNLQSLVGWVKIEGVNEEWSAYAASSYAFTCPILKTMWPSDNKWSVNVYENENQIKTGNPRRWSAQAFKEGGFRCAVSAYNLSNAMLGETRADGSKVSKHIIEKKRERERAKETARLRKLEIEKEKERERLAESQLSFESARSISRAPAGHNVVVNVGSRASRLSSGSTYVARGWIPSQTSMSNEEVYEGI